ncbi:hypothetical protein IJI79_00255 [Candidatus Saccharibacteria bacterium]|nr:hypothetical protein [Candidatus Saccharibacteria bacterium]MBR0423929.1 hypothetical protein [Candidatus Saccharibacteria bacterium]
MPTKKKKTTKTASKKVANKTHRKAATKTCCKKSCKELSNTERMHIYIVTALGFITAILLCMDVAMVNVS